MGKSVYNLMQTPPCDFLWDLLSVGYRAGQTPQQAGHNVTNTFYTADDTDSPLSKLVNGKHFSREV